jgi:hypothetical protein
MKEIVAITVSTNYEDILKIILPQNSKFFKKWYIITEEKDTKTIDTIKNSNCDNVEILFFTLSIRPKHFNKGGAIKYAQQLVLNKYSNDSIILILDSDIYLPNNFEERINETNIEDNVLYGSSKRTDYYTEDNFNKNILGKYYYNSRAFLGYFQMYKLNKNYLYQPSGDCAHCDAIFKRSFKKSFIIENLEVKHLGKAQINWKGRLSHDDFIPIKN